jgi:uncharacterized Zn-finger protein
MPFIIPAPVAPPPAPNPTGSKIGAPYVPTTAPSPGPPPGSPFPSLQPPRTTAARTEIPSFSITPLPQKKAPVEVREPEVLHIPCPQCKQQLETPVEMLDQEVLCPFCQAQFQLRRRDSVEFRRRRQQELEMLDRKAGRAWLNYAIAAVVLVVLFLLFLIFSSART